MNATATIRVVSERPFVPFVTTTWEDYSVQATQKAKAQHWNRVSQPDSTDIAQGHSFLYFSVMYEKGDRRSDYVLQETIIVDCEVGDGSFIVTLPRVEFSESGDTFSEAITNLFDFLTDILDERRMNPDIPLGRKLNEQMKILNRMFQYVPTDH